MTRKDFIKSDIEHLVEMYKKTREILEDKGIQICDPFFEGDGVQIFKGTRDAARLFNRKISKDKSGELSFTYKGVRFFQLGEDDSK